MKDLITFILETVNPKIEQIKQFIEKNYHARYIKISDKPNKDGKYEVDAYLVEVTNKKIESLANELFVWNVIEQYFDCTGCDNLTSLEGAPKEVGGEFKCVSCNSLTSLEGAPKEVGDAFSCYFCHSLKDLEGTPKEVGGNFNCHDCKSLTSLEGAPKEVGGDFKCWNCGYKFTKKNVKKACNVKGEIYC